MIRMSLITLVSIYLVLVVVGRDEGGGAAPQGLAEAAPETLGPGDLAQPEKLLVVAAAPAETLASITPVRLAPMPGPSLKPSPEHRVTPASPAATATGGAVLAVNATSANVRSGPSTGHDVVARLSRGEQVLVVASPGNGWVQIRIEGDGVNGWISERLLSAPH